MTNEVSDIEEFEVDTTNEFAVGFGQNLPNHSTSLAGRGKFVRQSSPEFPVFRTKQQAYRYAAYLVELADGADLPDEDGAEEHTFEVVRNAIRNA